MSNVLLAKIIRIRDNSKYNPKELMNELSNESWSGVCHLIDVSVIVIL